MTNRSLADHIAAHETLYDSYNARCRALSADDLSVRSLCPDWDVRGVLGHVIGVEHVLVGWEPSTDDPPPFGRMAEFAREIADLGPEAVASRVADVTAARLDHLRSLPDDAAAAPSITPTGVKTYGDFLRIRVFDLWVHAHDIALPLGVPVEVDPIAAAIAFDEVAGSLGYIVGKKVGLPDGMSAVFHVHGGVDADIAVKVDGRAAVLDGVDSPDVEVTADLETFMMLAAGRVDPAARIDAGAITWSGDAEWGERTARNLAYTM